MAYSEIYVTKIAWPDFRREHLYEAIRDFQRRERRYGLTGDQIRKTSTLPTAQESYLKKMVNALTKGNL
jgi:undecaprenyl diphosphate synthase